MRISKEANAKYAREWRKKNIDKSRLSVKRYYESHKELVKARNDANSEGRHAKQKEWREKNTEHRRLCQLWRLHNDPDFRLAHNLRRRFKYAMKSVNTMAKTSAFWGCKFDELKHHIESQFTDGMNWQNYGKWHVDHIRPVASFDLGDLEQVRQCFNYHNLRPLWAGENLRKSSKWRPECA